MILVLFLLWGFWGAVFLFFCLFVFSVVWGFCLVVFLVFGGGCLYFSGEGLFVIWFGLVLLVFWGVVVVLLVCFLVLVWVFFGRGVCLVPFPPELLLWEHWDAEQGAGQCGRSRGGSLCLHQLCQGRTLLEQEQAKS